MGADVDAASVAKEQERGGLQQRLPKPRDDWPRVPTGLLSGYDDWCQRCQCMQGQKPRRNLRPPVDTYGMQRRFVSTEHVMNVRYMGLGLT